MSGNDDKVLLDLNYPAFQSELFSLDTPELKKIIKTLKKISRMCWNDVFKDEEPSESIFEQGKYYEDFFPIETNGKNEVIKIAKALKIISE